MEINPTNFKEVFPEFASQSEARVQYFLDSAVEQISEAIFEKSYQRAVFFLAAHDLTMSDPSKAEKPQVTSEKVGDVSVTYSAGYVVKDADNYFKQTQYGLQFLRLRDSSVVGAIVL